MVVFRNNSNLRRNNFRRNDRNFKNNSDRPKFVSNFSNNENFQRNITGKNNLNLSKLIEKFNNLAAEAASGGDKILSENYFQHADHFTRIQNEQESFKRTYVESKSLDKDITETISQKTDNNLNKDGEDKSFETQSEIIS